MLASEKQVKVVEDIQDQLQYLQQIQDQCHKLRTQLSLGFDGNGECSVLLSMLVKIIREPIVDEIARIKHDYEILLQEEHNKILIKYGTRIIQNDETRMSIAEIFSTIAKENKLFKEGKLVDEKLTPRMFSENWKTRSEFEMVKFKADNIVNQNILQIVLDRLDDMGLLFNFEKQNLHSEVLH